MNTILDNITYVVNQAKFESFNAAVQFAQNVSVTCGQSIYVIAASFSYRLFRDGRAVMHNTPTPRTVAIFRRGAQIL